MTDTNHEEPERALEFERDLKHLRQVRQDMNRIATALERYIEWHRDHPDVAGPLVMIITPSPPP